MPNPPQRTTSRYPRSIGIGVTPDQAELKDVIEAVDLLRSSQEQTAEEILEALRGIKGSLTNIEAALHKRE